MLKHALANVIHKTLFTHWLLVITIFMVYNQTDSSIGMIGFISTTSHSVYKYLGKTLLLKPLTTAP